MSRARDLADLGDDVDAVVNGSAKAWVNFNGTGTVAIRGSMNVSSLTDNGTGDYVLGVTSAMADQNYSVSGTVAGSVVGMWWMRRAQSAAYRATTSFGGLVLYPSNTIGGGAVSDYDECDLTVHGDLA